MHIVRTHPDRLTCTHEWRAAEQTRYIIFKKTFYLKVGGFPNPNEFSLGGHYALRIKLRGSEAKNERM